LTLSYDFFGLGLKNVAFLIILRKFHQQPFNDLNEIKGDWSSNQMKIL